VPGPYNSVGKCRPPGGARAVRDQILAAIRGRLRDRDLDAYIAYTPSNVFYATGFQSYFLMQWWRMQGTVLATVPADETVEMGMMVGDFEAGPARGVSGIGDVRSYRLWPEIRDAEAVREPLAEGESEMLRPAQFDEGEQDGILRGLLGDRGLLGARIGTDLRYMLFDSYRRFSSLAPDAEWVDFTDDMYEIRSLKHPFEVERLRRATELSEAGMRFVVENLEPGMNATDVRHRYVMGVARSAIQVPATRITRTIGSCPPSVPGWGSGSTRSATRASLRATSSSSIAAPPSAATGATAAAPSSTANRSPPPTGYSEFSRKPTIWLAMR
jgi:Xaa-Pro dipeptidase